MTVAIDLFAGAGGFTAGATAAGVRVAWAANHWDRAVEFHARNHPDTVHACQDLHQADWSQVPDHDLLLASPACQGYSQAGQPGRVTRARAKHESDRNTAWAVIGCADARRPRTVLVENVPDFFRWTLYPAWRLALELAGYVVREHIFDAADFGVPQNRRRAIITARQGEPLDLVAPSEPWRAIDPFIDTSSDGWAPVRSKTAGVQSRVSRARSRGLGRRFLTQHVTNHPGRELSRPIGTITTKAHWALVDGNRMRMLTVPELRRAMSFPDTYSLPDHKAEAIRMLGNAIPPRMAAELVKQARDS